MPFDVAAAKAAGYTDSEIQSYLAAHPEHGVNAGDVVGAAAGVAALGGAGYAGVRAAQRIPDAVTTVMRLFPGGHGAANVVDAAKAVGSAMNRTGGGSASPNAAAAEATPSPAPAAAKPNASVAYVTEADIAKHPELASYEPGQEISRKTLDQIKTGTFKGSAESRTVKAGGGGAKQASVTPIRSESPAPALKGQEKTNMEPGKTASGNPQRGAGPSKLAKRAADLATVKAGGKVGTGEPPPAAAKAASAPRSAIKGFDHPDLAVHFTMPDNAESIAATGLVPGERAASDGLQRGVYLFKNPSEMDRYFAQSRTGSPRRAVYAVKKSDLGALAPDQSPIAGVGPNPRPMSEAAMVHGETIPPNKLYRWNEHAGEWQPLESYTAPPSSTREYTTAKEISHLAGPSKFAPPPSVTSGTENSTPDEIAALRGLVTRFGNHRGDGADEVVAAARKALQAGGKSGDVAASLNGMIKRFESIRGMGAEEVIARGRNALNNMRTTTTSTAPPLGLMTPEEHAAYLASNGTPTRVGNVIVGPNAGTPEEAAAARQAFLAERQAARTGGTALNEAVGPALMLAPAAIAIIRHLMGGGDVRDIGDPENVRRLLESTGIPMQQPQPKYGEPGYRGAI
jgi:hypothetical protein